MYKSNTLRIFPLILIVIVIIALVAGMITVGRYLFGSESGAPTEEGSVTAQDELLTLNTSRSVRLTIRGPIVADEEFETQRIAVSPISRQYKVYSGYIESIKKDKSYDNNMKAYEEFVYALDKAALTKPGANEPDEAEDVRGICATGKVYEYEILNAGEPVRRYWTSTCDGSPGTFGASVEQVNNLFVGQIPDDDKPNFRTSRLPF